MFAHVEVSPPSSRSNHLSSPNPFFPPTASYNPRCQFPPTGLRARGCACQRAFGTVTLNENLVPIFPKAFPLAPIPAVFSLEAPLKTILPFRGVGARLPLAVLGLLVTSLPLQLLFPLPDAINVEGADFGCVYYPSSSLLASAPLTLVQRPPTVRQPIFSS